MRNDNLFLQIPELHTRIVPCSEMQVLLRYKISGNGLFCCLIYLFKGLFLLINGLLNATLQLPLKFRETLALAKTTITESLQAETNQKTQNLMWKNRSKKSSGKVNE